MNSPCATGSIFGRLGCILDYDRNLVDVAINYSLFFVNLAVCVLALRLHTKDIEKSNKLRSYALASLIFGKQQTHTHNPVINDSACPKRDSHTHNRQIFFAFGALLFGCFLMNKSHCLSGGSLFVFGLHGYFDCLVCHGWLDH